MSNIILDKLNQIDSEICNRSDSVISFVSASTKNTAVQLSEQHILRADTFFKYEDIDGDEYYIAKVWAAQLKNLDSEQRLLAEKAIHDVLFEARLGNLNKTSVKINERKRRVKRINSSLYNSIVSKSLSNSKISIENSNEIKSSEVILTESFPSGINEIMNAAEHEPNHYSMFDNITDIDDITDTDDNKNTNNTDIDDVTDIFQSSRQQTIIIAATPNKTDDSSITNSGNESYENHSQSSKTLTPTKIPSQNKEFLSSKRNPSQDSETCSSTKYRSQNREICSTNMASATILPSILCQLSRYMTHLYNNYMNYIPE